MDDAMQRSKIMRAVKSKDTSPEIRVRKLLFKHGYRYRLHKNDLPGKPDIVFLSRRKVIFVHGCFWHGHQCNRGNRLPKTNTEYWTKKISRNKNRFIEQKNILEENGWSVFVAWECEIKDATKLLKDLHAYLD